MTDKQREGSPCSFWHEGGHGERRWVIGWRFGRILEIPSNGKRAGFVRIEIKTYMHRETVWVPAHDVNEPGDTTYHGPRTEQVLEDRAEKKAAEQAKADKLRAKARRFHR